ncbi:F-box/kelch-repeat protein At3g06240-like [Papaver somniferum]|uniref:F-box/kelch-repeat protein At3g06240-like n=1 Tax=Papaver somniferum TaxID=3469 RepID=UPI000E6FDB30|nr:F-box/kelch-repeat protein At3g06240-like [Papaver somniferum]
MSSSCHTRSKLKHIESIPLFLNLPEEVHEEIFLRLPEKSMLISRCVCKLFYNLLSKPNFINNHVNRTNQSKNNNRKLLCTHFSLGKHPMVYSIPIDCASISSSSSSLSCVCDGAVLIKFPFEPKSFPSLDFLGSCNGLICLKISSVDIAEIEKGQIVYTYYYNILNPLTREYKEFRWPGRWYQAIYGFGYDTNNDDYKLVIISVYSCVNIDVYSVRSDSWSSIQGTVNYSFRYGGKGSRGLFFNGALHWLGSIATQGISSEVIVSFDISNGTMLNMPIPEVVMPPTEYRGGMYANVGVWGDCICIAFIWGSVRIDVWVMQEYGVEESWIHIFATTQLPRPSYITPFWKPLWLFDNGEILVDIDGKQLLLCNPTTKTVRSVVVRDIKMDYNREIYVESIVSLGTGTYLEKQITHGVVKNPEQQLLR